MHASVEMFLSDCNYFSASADIDFTFPSSPLPFNVTFNPMDNRKAIDLHIIDDQLAAGDEFIALQLTNLAGDITIGQQTTLIKLQEDDGK